MSFISYACFLFSMSVPRGSRSCPEGKCRLFHRLHTLLSALQTTHDFYGAKLQGWALSLAWFNVGWSCRGRKAEICISISESLRGSASRWMAMKWKLEGQLSLLKTVLRNALHVLLLVNLVLWQLFIDKMGIQFFHSVTS